jgi:hypothetical protein
LGGKNSGGLGDRKFRGLGGKKMGRKGEWETGEKMRKYED